jgi:hypothetical protein
MGGYLRGLESNVAWEGSSIAGRDQNGSCVDPLTHRDGATPANCEIASGTEEVKDLSRLVYSSGATSLHATIATPAVVGGSRKSCPTRRGRSRGWSGATGAAPASKTLSSGTLGSGAPELRSEGKLRYATERLGGILSEIRMASNRGRALVQKGCVRRASASSSDAQSA